jgi:hypothetical protein
MANEGNLMEKDDDEDDNDELPPIYLYNWKEIKRELWGIVLVVTTIVNIGCIYVYFKTPNRGIIECQADGVHIYNNTIRLNGLVDEKMFQYVMMRACGGRPI